MYKPLTIEEIIKVTAGKLAGNVTGTFHLFSTDTRTIQKDDIFVPLTGPNFDGHNYINEAFTKGAKLTLAHVGKSITASGNPVLYVDDTLEAYGKIARYYLEKFSSKVIAVTGSVGKTTIKEMIVAILKARFDVEATYKNYNNRIGVPQTILSLSSEPDFIVLEMGTNTKGEIQSLVEIAPPHYSLITTIGSAHLAGFHTINEIVKEKSHIYYGTRKEGYAFVNLDDPRVVEASTEAACKKIFYSVKHHEAPFQLNSFSQNGTGWKIDARLKAENLYFKLPLLGYHNIINALGAMAVSYVAGAKASDIKSALEHFKSPHMRGELLVFKRGTVFCDCYNANPESTKAALDSFKSLLKGAPGLVILGDMLELGSSSRQLHEEIGEYASALDFAHTLLIGNEMKYAYRVLKDNAKTVDYVRSYEEAKIVLEKIIPNYSSVLLKGSRGMRLERIIDDFYKE